MSQTIDVSLAGSSSGNFLLNLLIPINCELLSAGFHVHRWREWLCSDTDSFSRLEGRKKVGLCTSEPTPVNTAICTLCANFTV